MPIEVETFRDIDSLPTEYERRTCTDIFCIWCGIGFTLIMIILAAVFFSYPNFFKVNFPSDSQGHLCGIDYPKEPYLYFVNPPEMNRRVCVAQCPTNSNQPLKCRPTSGIGCAFNSNPGFQVQFYNNEPSETRSGMFCFPTDENLKEQLLDNAQLTDRNSFYNSLDTIVLSFFVALGFSLAFMLFVQFLPKIMNYATVGVGMIAILVTIICVFLYQTSQTTGQTVIGVCLIVVLVIILLTICKNTDSWKMHAIFLSQATKMICDRCSSFFYIPIFFAAIIGFSVILVLEFTAYWSYGDVSFHQDESLFHQLSEGVIPIIMSVLLIVQAIWGLSFIKEAFNFCVSGQAVNWYFDEDKGFFYAFKLLLCKHMGSVIGGAFMTGFFSIGDFLFDFVKPDENANPDGCYNKCYQCCCKCCFLIFDLIRSDAMAFINLTGNPFCNSSRYCEFLCDRSVIMDYSQSTSRAYRICAHFLLVGIMTIFALYVKGNISIFALLVVMIQTLFISTLFISIHADAAEAIQIVFLADEEFIREKKEDNQAYDRNNLEDNLKDFSRRQDLMEEVRKEREIQRKIRQEEEND